MNATDDSSNEFKFYEYNNGTINQMSQASTAFLEEYKECFLIYAENENEAFKLAMKHIYEDKPMVILHDIDYMGEHYDTVKNVVCRTSSDIFEEKAKAQKKQEEFEERLKLLREHLESNQINIHQFVRTMVFINHMTSEELIASVIALMNIEYK